jgi:hypothetical protein
MASRLAVNLPQAVASLLTDDETVPLPTLSIGGPVPLPTFPIDANTISGQSAFATTGAVFNTVPHGLMGPIMVTPRSPTIPFTSTRLPGDVPCSEAVTMFP